MIIRVADQIAAESQTGIVLFFPANLTYHIIAEGPRKKPHITCTRSEIQVVSIFGKKVPLPVSNPCILLSFACKKSLISSALDSTLGLAASGYAGISPSKWLYIRLTEIPANFFHSE